MGTSFHVPQDVSKRKVYESEGNERHPSMGLPLPPP